ncbi:MAG: ADP-ribosyl-[dinitrogen reductase] hydrolase [Deltaproteobacteria bacterium HGW-Deltaproteobacteria-4]|nr:MAG: ADP-ribosyl-[dinitrogen reductase] hydrolase [Deltaproteobacteria bacterium HGW-Deltaproteobacteria-4]
MTNSSPDALTSRARAAFLGLALGDALGATTEFMTPGEIRNQYKVHRQIIGGGWLHLKAGRVTDDTEMSLCVARAIVDRGEWELAAIADNFVSWMKGKPIDIGSTCRKGIRDYLLNGTLEQPYSDNDAGNGALMRLLPTALFTLGDAALLRRCAIEQAHLTHHHPLSDAACLTFGKMIHAALCGADRFALHAIARELIAAHPKFHFNDYRGHAGGYVVETMQTVLHYFFTTSNFEDCLIGIVNQGGDADTTGAIGGALAGAFYGMEQLPRAWSKKLDAAVSVEVQRLAGELVRLSPAGLAHFMLKDQR